MELSRKTIWLIVTLMVISLTGLVGLQASWLKSDIESKAATFQQNVLAAMRSVAGHLEATETTRATMRVFGNTREIVLATHRPFPGTALPGQDSATDTSSYLKTTIRYMQLPETDSLYVHFEALELTDPQCFDSGSLLEAFVLESNQEQPDSAIMMISHVIDNAWVLGKDSTGENQDTEWYNIIDSSRFEIITQVMDRLVAGQDIPIEERIDSARLDSLITATLIEHGITLEPAYAVISEQDDSLHFQHPSGYSEELKTSELRASLFPHDILAASNSLALYFPERGFYIFKQIGLMLFATVVFMLIVVIGFVYTIRIIVAQRRTARQMVDFVNNMTHEFKTPISTVALACEAIMRSDVIKDSEKVTRFPRMIQDENRRMRHQAEKILQLAALEERQGNLKLTEVDLHDVINNAVDSIALQVEKRDGLISCHLASHNHVLQADEVHLMGIVYNLLDNANKYSPEAPRITVTTEDVPDGLRLIIEDQGIGLNADDRKRIFDKYYRVSHGNLHDVKGFGLGLSYVSLMVKAHGGKITVKSKSGKGTQMILWFPRPDDQTGSDQEVLA